MHDGIRFKAKDTGGLYHQNFSEIHFFTVPNEELISDWAADFLAARQPNISWAWQQQAFQAVPAGNGNAPILPSNIPDIKRQWQGINAGVFPTPRYSSQTLDVIGHLPWRFLLHLSSGRVIWLKISKIFWPIIEEKQPWTKMNYFLTKIFQFGAKPTI